MSCLGHQTTVHLSLFASPKAQVFKTSKARNQQVTLTARSCSFICASEKKHMELEYPTPQKLKSISGLQTSEVISKMTFLFRGAVSLVLLIRHWLTDSIRLPRVATVEVHVPGGLECGPQRQTEKTPNMKEGHLRIRCETTDLCLWKEALPIDNNLYIIYWRLHTSSHGEAHWSCRWSILHF